MITVKNFLENYCEIRKLPPPSKADLESCGRIISHHFKHYWAKEIFYGLIPDFGFIVNLEGSKKVVVQAYPDIFKSEMANRIDIYYSRKSKPKIESESLVESVIPTTESPTKKRKRIPPKPTKEISVKPTNAVK